MIASSKRAEVTLFLLVSNSRGNFSVCEEAVEDDAPPHATAQHNVRSNNFGGVRHRFQRSGGLCFFLGRISTSSFPLDLFEEIRAATDIQFAKLLDEIIGYIGRGAPNLVAGASENLCSGTTTRSRTDRFRSAIMGRSASLIRE